MSLDWLILGVLVVLAAGLAGYVIRQHSRTESYVEQIRRRREQQKAATERAQMAIHHSSADRRGGNFSAVAIQVPANAHACWAVARIGNRRFLARQAPKLPLPGCDCTQCHCYYENFDDRRQYQRRSSSASAVLPSHISNDRRSHTERRVNPSYGS